MFVAIIILIIIIIYALSYMFIVFMRQLIICKRRLKSGNTLALATMSLFIIMPRARHYHLRNRQHFPCFYRVIETRVEVWEKREIAWEHEHEVRVFPRNFEFLPNFHKYFYNSI